MNDDEDNNDDNKNNDSSLYLPNAYRKLGAILSTLHVLTHLLLITNKLSTIIISILQVRKESTERLSNLPRSQASKAVWLQVHVLHYCTILPL